MCKKNQDGKTVWLSLGENCLPDDILSRFHLKSYSSPFASCRSNIDYLIEMHTNKYDNLFDEESVSKFSLDGGTVLRSIVYNKSHPIYHNLHTNGFEFTHHNWIDNPDLKQSLQRRLRRMVSDIGCKDFVFLYHHRITESSDTQKIRLKLSLFADFFTSNYKKCKIIFFYQNLTSEDSERRVITKDLDDNVLEYEIITTHAWEGSNQNIFWARVDNDLLKTMIESAKNHI